MSAFDPAINSTLASKLDKYRFQELFTQHFRFTEEFEISND